ncbi:hypothetical protein Gohar_016290 [Gossypium harknessii]|uniref:RRM domain-containing protein n=1 Tax=Gossypium harknessii TaxID=34285 RepID=A0A7J9G4K8_9ROSI|nr:hypothetical protein [Gossypium harknessii]
MEKIMPVESQVTRYLEPTESFTKQNREANLSVDSRTVGAERVSNQSLKLLKPVSQGLGTTLSFGGENGFHSDEGNKVNTVTSLSENSLFSSSFSEFFTRKLRLSSNNALYGNSIDTVASDYEEEEPLESLEELEAQTIGNLLPDDDDLFSGVTEGLDSIVQPNGTEDAEELDVFSSIGGMDLGDDGPGVRKNYEFPEKSRPGLLNGSVAGEHPSRTLFVRNINSNVEDSELKAVFELYGEIRALDSACKHRGFVMISYFDIRAAQKAIEALQDRPLRSRKLDIHYSIPKLESKYCYHVMVHIVFVYITKILDNPLENEENQGTLVVFNLNSTVSNDEIRCIFGAYGEIKEIYETPKKSQHKFIEFYDVRASEAALHALNKTEIAGNLVEIQLSHPESLRRCSVQQVPSAGKDECYPYEHPYSPSNDANLAFSVGANSSNNMDIGTSSGLNSAIKAPFLEPTVHHGISSGVSNSLTSMVRAGSIGNQSVNAESDHLQMKFDIQGAPAFYPYSLPEYQNGLSRAIHSSSKPLEIIDNNSFSLVSSTGHSFEYRNAGFPSAGNGSHLPGLHCSWSNSYHPEPPSMMWPNSPSMVNGIYAARPSAQLHGLPTAHTLNTGVPVINYHVGSAPTVNPSLWDRRHAYGGESPKASSFHLGSLGSMRGSSNFPHSKELKSRNIFPYVAGSPHEHARSRRNEGSINGADKKQYELDIECIIRGEDKRTTLMLKNIPNKYTSKMLLAAIDERSGGTYDFNKCNVGYAFINMIEPSQVITFYQAFNGKKWEKFNSEKVASLAYARIQGKAALIAHFQNSSLMNEDKRCRPILFNTDGPNAGDQVPFPVRVNVRTRSGKAARSSNNEENNQESPSNSENEANSSN